MFSPSREQARQFLVESWRKRSARLPGTPLETIAGDVIALHPEYHALLDATNNSIERTLDRALDRDWSPDTGVTNPFLHLSLHLAIEEQLSIDQPRGISSAYKTLLFKHGDRHEALHAVLDCLAETLWRSQRDGTPLDSKAYLELLQAATNKG